MTPKALDASKWHWMTHRTQRLYDFQKSTKSVLFFIEGYNGYVVFVWIYGIFNGGYHYTLKMYIYEKVRARNFARAWGFTQFSMAIPNAIGITALGKSYLLKPFLNI